MILGMTSADVVMSETATDKTCLGHVESPYACEIIVSVVILRSQSRESVFKDTLNVPQSGGRG